MIVFPRTVGSALNNQKNGEDRVVTNSNFQAVFDGHRGNAISEYAANHFHSILLQQLSFKSIKTTQSPTTHSSPNTTNNLNNTTTVDSLEIAKDALRETFLQLHEDARRLKQLSGTTAVVFWCCQVASSSSEWFGLCANAGDSRAVLSISSTAKRLTVDHTATCEFEKNRIENVGGKVEFGRVADAEGDGVLCVSRGIGNFDLEPSFIPDPHLSEPINLNDNTNEFIILASDGLWDVFTDQEVVDLVKKDLLSGNTPRTCAAHLTQISAERGSKDDTTVVVIVLCEHLFNCCKENLKIQNEKQNRFASPEKPEKMMTCSNGIGSGSKSHTAGNSVMQQQPPRRVHRPPKKARHGSIRIRYKDGGDDDDGEKRKVQEDDDGFDFL